MGVLRAAHNHISPPNACRVLLPRLLHACALRDQVLAIFALGYDRASVWSLRASSHVQAGSDLAGLPLPVVVLVKLSIICANDLPFGNLVGPGVEDEELLKTVGVPEEDRCEEQDCCLGSADTAVVEEVIARLHLDDLLGLDVAEKDASGTVAVDQAHRGRLLVCFNHLYFVVDLCFLNFN